MLHALRLGILALIFASFLATASAATSCNDIDISPLNVTFAENRDNRLITFDIENNADDDFQIDDVRVQESSLLFDVSVDDFPDEVKEDEREDLRLRYDTVDVNGNKTETFRIQVRGEFDNNDECEFTDLSFTVHVTIQDGDDVCSLIRIEADDVTVTENEKLLHTIRVTNNSSNDFTMQGFDVFDDGDSFSARADPPFTDSDFEKDIVGGRTNTYTIEIDAQGVSEDETDSAFVEIRGEFEDGFDCSFSDISEEFDVTVEDTGVQSGVCTEINVNIPFVQIVSGETSTHTFTLTNNASQNFYVDEYTFADKNYQVEFAPVSNPVKVDFESSEEIAFETTGYSNPDTFDANAFLTLKGHFTDGGSCMVNAKRFAYRFIGSGKATCDSFYADLQPITVLKGEKNIDVLFNNPLAHDAILYIASNNGTVSPSRITIPADTVKLQTFFVSNVNEEQILTIQTELPGCTVPDKLSTVLFSGLDDAPVQFVNPPAVLNIAGANEFALQIENKSAFTQEVTLTVIGKPGVQTFTKTLQIPGLDEPLIYIPTDMLRGKSVAIVQLKSAGYTVTQTIQLENENTAQAPLESAPRTPIEAAASAITGFVTGSGAFWGGLLVLVVVVGLWFAAKPKALDEKDVNITNMFNTGNSDQFDEVWMPSRKN